MNLLSARQNESGPLLYSFFSIMSLLFTFNYILPPSFDLYSSVAKFSLLECVFNVRVSLISIYLSILSKRFKHEANIIL